MKRTLLITVVTAIVSLFVVQTAAAYQVSQPNCGGLRWAPSDLPVDYTITNGSNDQTAGWNMPLATVETVMQTSFTAWETPCCSSFRARYQGQTADVAWNARNNPVMSVVNNQWDQSWGDVNSTIGITLVTFNPQACTIGNAPIVFNGVRFQFTNNNSGTDLQSIATHEIGHLLGLDHSSLFQATMYFAYQGGTVGRSLHEDDIDGVCFLYNRPCTCATSNDCLDGDICQNGVCRNVPCTSNTQCQDGLECNQATGECIVPPCGSDADCPGGFFCKADGDCASRCPVCRTCNQNSDCGSQGVCITDIGKCVTYCQQGNVCPGDSDCFNYQGANICLNPSAANGAGFCPQDYVCEDTGNVAECSNDTQCGAEQQCVSGVCQAKDDACRFVTCRTDAVCIDGECVVRNPNNANNTNTNNSNPNNVNNVNNINNVDPTNNVSGNNANNTGGPTGPVIIIREQNQEEGCATAAGHSTSGWPLLLFGLLFGWRRRREHT